MNIEFLQNYWWVIISILGGILVFMLFVQGGQSMIYSLGRNENDRNLLLEAMGSKWEITFTTLVVFGGAFFASFPLFYSTSFGGAYWLWILILFSFVLQAVSYEYRRKKGNVYGQRTYDAFLFFNGLVGCVLLGVAVSMFFFGADFTVSRNNILNVGSPVISRWAPTHGLEAICNWKNLVLGIAVFFLARTQACMYLMLRLKESHPMQKTIRQKAFINGGIFVVFILAFLALVLTTPGYTVISEGGTTSSVTVTPYRYWFNLIEQPWILAILLIGVVLVLYGWLKGCFVKKFNKGIWFTGIGTFLTVVAIFFLAGLGNVAFYPSLTDPMSSLTIQNASSSKFTLSVMSIVSLLIPFVVAYIFYAWYSMDRKKL